MTDFICKCNNCETLMFDKNPDWHPTQTVPENVQNMVMLGEPLEGMILLEEETMAYAATNDVEPSLFWACPKCLTDDYLADYLPDAVKELFEEYEENRGITDNALLLKENLESVGYTIDVDELYGSIENLRKI